MTTSREAALSKARSMRHVPVVIAGAGINGAGLYRDLSMQGVDCLLCDKSDICSGASAAPSRLIHGGLKYLETGEFRLVAQSTLERNLLLGNAPHAVRPLKTVIPIFSWFGGIVPSIARVLGVPAKLSDRGVLITELGLGLYDLFGSRERAMPRHGLALRRRSLAGLPALKPDIVATGSYYDAAVTLPERLGLELVLDGGRANPGSVALTHTGLAGRDGDALLLRDETTGEALRVTADVVVNAGGAWIDRVNAKLGLERTYIGGTKGSHLLLDNPELVRQLDGRMVYFGSPDGRICLVYPYFGLALVGSTDIRADDPDAAVCEDAEAAYMLEAVAAMFPGVAVAPGQVVYRYCGVRPLPAADVDDPGRISRDHSIREDVLAEGRTPVLSLVGGKWTTFRGFAEEAADRVLALVGKERRVSTRHVAIGGGRDFPAGEAARAAWIGRVSASSGLEAGRVACLLDRYGTRAEAFAARAGSHGDRPLSSLPDYSVGEIAQISDEELVGSLADVIFRRTTIAITGRLTPEALDELAGIVAGACGWPAGRRDREAAEVRAIAVTRHGIALDAGGGTSVG